MVHGQVGCWGLVGMAGQEWQGWLGPCEAHTVQRHGVGLAPGRAGLHACLEASTPLRHTQSTTRQHSSRHDIRIASESDLASSTRRGGACVTQHSHLDEAGVTSS